MVIVNLDNRFVRANAALCKFLGYTEEELKQMTFEDVTHPDDIGPSRETRRMLGVADVGSVELEKRYVHKDGNAVWAWLSAAPLFGSDGKITGFISQIQDISERKKAEQAVRESEERFRTIAEAIPVPVLISTISDDRILFANQRLAEAFGLPVEGLVGSKTLDFYHDPADREVLLDRLSAHGFLEDYELRARRADGSPFWQSSSIRQVTFEGKPAIFTAFLDTTVRKEAEQAVRESEERFRLITETIPIPVVITRVSDGTALFANQRFADAFGVRLEEAIGQKAPDYYVDPADRAAVLRSLSVSDGVHSYECEVRRADGKRFWLAGTYARINFAGADAILAAFYDTTERRRAEAALRASEERFIEYSKAPMTRYF